MDKISRKNFLQLSAVLAGTAAPAFAKSKPAKSARVVVIGGGFGGATCAKYIRNMDSKISVTLIEKNKNYITCPMSNTVLGGINQMSFITHGYAGLQKHGVKVVHDLVTEIDPVKKSIKMKSGKIQKYDYLVVSPGIELLFDQVQGYSKNAASAIPHAYEAGKQTEILFSQIKAMPKNGTVIIAPPDNPFRCPPGPYERTSMIAHYMKKHKPDGKILILDAKDTFAKKPLFEKAWEVLYLGMVEFVAGSQGGKVERIDVAKKEIITSSGTHKGDVINLIPPQRAGAIAVATGLTKGNWCAVNQSTFESEIHKGIYVIGDSAIAGAMPKSGFSANSQAKTCAAAIVSSVNGIKMPDPSYVNTCYSLVADNYGISVAAVYKYDGAAIVGIEGSGGVSPMEADFDYRQKEAKYAMGWYDSIIKDSLM